MTNQVPVHDDIERVFIITVDALRWEFFKSYQEMYPNGVWYRATPQATYTPPSHASLFTGLNPPRHGIYMFNEKLRTETLYDATDGLVTSSLVIDNGGLKLRAPMTESSFRFPDLLPDELRTSDYRDADPEETGWQLAEGDSLACLDEVADRDPSVVWFHDWIVHASGKYGDPSWAPTINDVPPETAHDQYGDLVDLDARVHARFLDELKARDLYENSLFIVWGDHGQSFGEPPFGVSGHGLAPCEGSSRVPIGFCSPVFEKSGIDRETNPRSVDVLPTLRTLLQESGQPWLDVTHDDEGVDLTSFEGTLAGYTIGGNTLDTDMYDAVRTATHAYIRASIEVCLETPFVADRSDISTIQTEVEASHRQQRLEQWYEQIRREADRLIVQDESNNDVLEALGYR